MSDRVGVIGAGPAGLAAAYSLGKSGIPVDVFEASDAVGGMAQTIPLWNQLVDLGPHRFFSTNATVNRLWLEIVGSDYHMVERRTRIYYNDKFFDYPLRLADSLGKLGSIESVLCLMSYLRQQLRCDRPAANFEQWVRGRFGQRLYERFFRDYSEKLWGIRCESLDADFAAQRIRKLSLYEAARNALANGRGNRHATLADQFAYPIDGTGSVYRKMADAIFRQSGAVFLGKAVRRVRPHSEEGMELELASGERHTYRHIISTMPLTQLIHALPDAPQKVLDADSRLHYRNTILVYLRMDAQSLFPDQWIYIHAPELAVGRITNFRNWIPELYRESTDTILALESWHDPDSKGWRAADEQHIQRAIEDLHQTKLATGAPITAAHVVRIPFCYPVYKLGYKNYLGVLRDYLQTMPRLQVIGRYGSFKYNNQDHSLLMGILAAENIALARNHDLWSVNADDEYQEASIIDKTGLVPQLS
jgi:protoporphyrinogen oxidase